MKLPHATVMIEKPIVPGFKRAEFTSTGGANATITRDGALCVKILTENWSWSEHSLEDFAEFLTALAKQLRDENKK